MNPNDLIGKTYTFPDDGTRMTVIQIKNKDVDNNIIPFVTYEISQGNSLPRKLVMAYNTFVIQFGHLYGLKDPPTH